MTKWQKKALWMAGIPGAILLAAVVILPALFDAERIRSMAQEKAYASWTRQLSIGDISLRLRPFPELHAQNVVLANPSWAANSELLNASNVTAHLDLLALLRREIRVTRLSVDGLKVHLEVSPKRVRSWDLKADGKPPDRSQPENDSPGFLHLKAVRIRNADIHYQNRGEENEDKEISEWRLDEFDAKSQAGLREVRIDARVTRNRQPLNVEARFDDLSRIGEEGAVSAGDIELRWDSSHLKLAGKIPLQNNLMGHDLKLKFMSDSLADVLGFFGTEGRRTAKVKFEADLADSDRDIKATGLSIALGEQTMTGSAQIALAGSKPKITGFLETDRFDWARMMEDAGSPPPPSKPADEFFDVHPLAWKTLLALQGIEGSLETRFASMKLRSGIELKNAKARMNLKDGDLNMSAFSAALLGGSMSGSLQLNSSKKSVRLHLDATDVSLARWYAERGRKIAFTGGPMNIKASVTAAGASMKDLAASLNGPVSISMGPGVILSEKAGETESLLIGTFAGAEAGRINLQCAGAKLPFSRGRAAAEPLVGARSDTSHLLTAGLIDLREQIIDLRGRIRPASGVSLGVSAVTGDVRIAGRLGQIEFGLDPAGAPEALARLGAAIATGGASILGTAIWDAASGKGDPCAIVSGADRPPAPKKSAR